MRVLHLSTSRMGGAGKSASQIVNSQRNIGIAAELYERRIDKKYFSLLKSVPSRTVTVIQKTFTHTQYDLMTPLSVSTLDQDLLESFSPDILHIHNWYNFLSITNLKELTDKYPVVFTMHDMRLVTGGCHVTLGCKNYLSKCTSCPGFRVDSLVRKAKSDLDQAISGFRNYAIAAPSQWLLDQIKETELLKNSRFHEVIENPIDTRLDVEIAVNKPEIFKCLFVSASLDANFKGLPLLLEALGIFRQKHRIKMDITLVGATSGNYNLESDFMKITTIGIKSNDEVAELMRQSNFLLVPSLADNKPGVIREAQLLGLPVIATRIGGIPEMITNGKTGYLTPANSINFAQTLYEAIKSEHNEQIAKNARLEALQETNPETISTRYVDLYKRLLVNA